MGPLWTPIESCLRHNYTILVQEVLVILIPLLPVNDKGLETSAEGLENIFIYSLIVGSTPTLEDSSRTHRQAQQDVHALESLFGKRLRTLTNKRIKVFAGYVVRQFVFIYQGYGGQLA